MTDTDAALKINPKNKEAVERKQRLQKNQSQTAPPPANATPVAAPPKKKPYSRRLRGRGRSGFAAVLRIGDRFLFRRRQETSLPSVRRQRRQSHGDIASGNFWFHLHLRHSGKIVTHFFN